MELLYQYPIRLDLILYNTYVYIFLYTNRNRQCSRRLNAICCIYKPNRNSKCIHFSVPTHGVVGSVLKNRDSQQVI